MAEIGQDSVPGASPQGGERHRPVWRSAWLVFGGLLVICGGPVALLVLVLIPAFHRAQVRSLHPRTRSDLRSMETGIEMYYHDFKVYPAHTEIPSESFMGAAAPGRPSFRLRNGTNLRTITTPFAYLNASYIGDQYSPVAGGTFCYYTSGDGWIMWSPGPDGGYEIDPARDYDPSRKEPTEALVSVTYDPTNGTFSRGDTWRIRQ